MRSFLLSLFFLHGIFAMAQSNAKYQVYINRIKQFSQPAKILSDYIDKTGNGDIEFTNAKKQVLRFRVKDQKLETLHGGISYQLFYYQNGYVQRIETFNSHGDLAGDREFENEAVETFIIEKPALYLKKKKIIDDAEGNIALKDDSDEKIIRVQLYDKNNLPIQVFSPTYISSKTYWQYNIRMYWP